MTWQGRFVCRAQLQLDNFRNAQVRTLLLICKQMEECYCKRVNRKDPLASWAEVGESSASAPDRTPFRSATSTTAPPFSLSQSTISLIIVCPIGVSVFLRLRSSHTLSHLAPNPYRSELYVREFRRHSSATWHVTSASRL